MESLMHYIFTTLILTFVVPASPEPVGPNLVIGGAPKVLPLLPPARSALLAESAPCDANVVRSVEGHSVVVQGTQKAAAGPVRLAISSTGDSRISLRTAAAPKAGGGAVNPGAVSVTARGPDLTGTVRFEGVNGPQDCRLD